MAGNSAWNQTVKKAFKMGRSVNKGYSLKQAMKDAKKIYRKGKGMSMTAKKYRRSSKKSGYGRRRTHGRRYRGGESLGLPIPKLMGGDQEEQEQKQEQDEVKGGTHATVPKMVMGGKNDDEDEE